MARLIMGPKVFATVMREIYGFRNFKANRAIEQATKRGSNLIVNLDPQTANEFSSALHFYSVDKTDKSIFNDEYALALARGLDSMSEAELQVAADGLAIQYSVEEYRDLVMKCSPEKRSVLDPKHMYGVYNIHVGISEYRDQLNSMFKVLLARGAGSSPSGSGNASRA